MEKKNNFRLRKVATAFLLTIFLFGIVPLAVLPVPVSAHHNIKVEFSGGYKDGLGQYYFAVGAPVTIKYTDAGGDGFAIENPGLIASEAGNKIEDVAYECRANDDKFKTNECTTQDFYDVIAGGSHLWTWDQQYHVAGKAGQVPEDVYFFDSTITPLNHDYSKEKQAATVDFFIEKDSDKDGMSDTPDLCDNEVPVQDLNKDGCDDSGDMDGDGTKNNYDKCMSEAGPPATNGCSDADNDGIADRDDACDNQPETKNDFQDSNGCPDKNLKETKEFWGNVRTVVEVAGDVVLGVASGFVCGGTLGFGCALAIAGEVIGGSGFHISNDKFRKDPPDLLNYKSPFVADLRLPAAVNELPVANDIDAKFKEFDINAFLFWKNLDALTPSIERHDGAIQMHDYGAANMQAGMVRSYAENIKIQLLKLKVSSENLAIAMDALPESNFPIGMMTDAQNKARLEGLQKDEIDFAKAIGLSDAELEILENMFLSVDATKLPDAHLSKYLRAFAPYLSEYYAKHFDYISKVFGANLYVSAGPKSVPDETGIISYGIYYEAVPNDAQAFVFTVDYDSKLKFVGYDTPENNLIGAVEKKKNHITVTGVMEQPIKAGDGGRIITLNFKQRLLSGLLFGRPLTRNAQYDLEISGVAGDVKGWLTAPNYENFCDFDDANLVCDLNAEQTALKTYYFDSSLQKFVAWPEGFKLPATSALQPSMSQISIFKNGAWVFVTAPTTPWPSGSTQGTIWWDGTAWITSLPSPYGIVWVGSGWSGTGPGTIPPKGVTYIDSTTPTGKINAWDGYQYVLADKAVVDAAPPPNAWPMFDVGTMAWAFTSQMPPTFTTPSAPVPPSIKPTDLGTYWDGEKWQEISDLLTAVWDPKTGRWHSMPKASAEAAVLNAPRGVLNPSLIAAPNAPGMYWDGVMWRVATPKTNRLSQST